MCELYDSKGEFWHRVYASVAEPVRFMGYVFWRRHDEQVLRDKQAVRRADTAVNELRKLEADDKAVFEAFEGCAFEIEYRRPHLRAALANAYRAANNAELGCIVADEVRRLLEQHAEDAACEVCENAEYAEREVAERETLTERRACEAERAHRAVTEGTP